MCFISCSISNPSHIFYHIEKKTNDTIHPIERSRFDVEQRGYYAGLFADDASLYVGTLANSGEYQLWVVLVDKSTVSDVYYYEFAIPCLIPSIFSRSSLLSDRQRGFAEYKTRSKWKLGAFCERAGREIPGLSHSVFGISRQARRASFDRAGSPTGRGVFDLFLGPCRSPCCFHPFSER